MKFIILYGRTDADKGVVPRTYESDGHILVVSAFEDTWPTLDKETRLGYHRAELTREQLEVLTASAIYVMDYSSTEPEYRSVVLPLIHPNTQDRWSTIAALLDLIQLRAPLWRSRHGALGKARGFYRWALPLLLGSESEVCKQSAINAAERLDPDDDYGLRQACESATKTLASQEPREGSEQFEACVRELMNAAKAPKKSTTPVSG